MKQDSENFDDLRKLLALKKHEQPPPGYFNELPGRIWSRIEKEQAAPSFWEGFLSRFVLRPTVAYGFALVVCATLIVGIGTSLNDGGTVSRPGTPVVQQQLPQGFESKTAGAHSVTGAQVTNVSSTNPVAPSPSLQLQVHPAAFNRSE